MIAQPSASAEPPPPFSEPQERLVIEACILSSEIPHLSKHVPGTVNATGRTVCKGISAGRVLSIVYTIKTVHKLSNGKTRTTANEATLKC